VQKLSQGTRNPASPKRGRKVVVEYNDLHLRGTILGALISNLYEYMGWDVVRLNYLGDFGGQVGLLAAG
jgi:arginyl-tRNA synthetase